MRSAPSPNALLDSFFSKPNVRSSCKPEEWVKAWKIDDWNTARVLVEGKYPKVTTWINGQQVRVWDGATSNAKSYDKEAVLKALGTEGSIAVQVHGGQNWPAGAKCRWKTAAGNRPTGPGRFWKSFATWPTKRNSIFPFESNSP